MRGWLTAAVLPTDGTCAGTTAGSSALGSISCISTLMRCAARSPPSRICSIVNLAGAAESGWTSTTVSGRVSTFGSPLVRRLGWSAILLVLSRGISTCWAWSVVINATPQTITPAIFPIMESVRHKQIRGRWQAVIRIRNHAHLCSPIWG